MGRAPVDQNLHPAVGQVPGNGHVHPGTGSEAKTPGVESEIAIRRVLEPEAQAAVVAQHEKEILVVAARAGGIQQHAIPATAPVGVAFVPEGDGAYAAHRIVDVHPGVHRVIHRGAGAGGKFAVAASAGIAGDGRGSVVGGDIVAEGLTVVAVAGTVDDLSRRAGPGRLVQRIPCDEIAAGTTHGTTTRDGVGVIDVVFDLLAGEGAAIDPKLVDETVEVAPRETLVGADLQRPVEHPQRLVAVAAGRLLTVDIDTLEGTTA